MTCEAIYCKYEKSGDNAPLTDLFIMNIIRLKVYKSNSDHQIDEKNTHYCDLISQGFDLFCIASCSMPPISQIHCPPSLSVRQMGIPVSLPDTTALASNRNKLI